MEYFRKTEKSYAPAKEGEHTHVMFTIDEYNEIIANTIGAEKLCKTLLRINKQNKNRDRGIKNAKKHDGYIVLRSQQLQPILFNYTDERDVVVKEKNNVFSGWKTTIQTPLEITIPFEQVKQLTKLDILYKILRVIKYNFENEEYLTVPEKIAEMYISCGYSILNIKEKNYVYDVRYTQQTHHPGLWEVTLCHTNSVVIPDKLWLNPPKQKGESKDEKKD